MVKKCLKFISLILIIFVLIFSTSNMSFAIAQNIAEKENTNIENTENTNSNTSNNVTEQENNTNQEQQKNKVIQEEQNKENTIQNETVNSKQEVTKNEEEQINVQSKSVLRSGTYIGDISHQILEIHFNTNANGSGYIWGKFIFIEWINGQSTVPSKNPTVTLKDDENTKSYECFVSQEWGNTYYFDIFVDSIDYNKTYNFEIASGDSRNISENQVSNLKISNQNLGENKDYYVLIQNNQLAFRKITYVGDALSELVSFGIANTAKGNSYIYGNLVYVEWVNGVSTVPEKNPIITLESEDGTSVRNLYVNQISGNTYYFDGYIDGIDTSKKYYIKTASGDSKNISTNQKVTLNFSNKTGKYSNYAYDINLNSDRTITLNKNVYYGNATNEVTQFNLTNTARGYSYIYGQVIYIEWVNGASTVPEFMPKMILKSTDGTYEEELYISQVFGNTYYFDGYIEGIDTDKQYYLEMQSGDFRNES